MTTDFRTFDTSDRPVTMTLVHDGLRAIVMFSGEDKADGAIVTKTDGTTKPSNGIRVKMAFILTTLS